MKLEEITLPELVRSHNRLEDDHKELHIYAHNNGHDILNIKTIIPLLRSSVDKIEEKVEEMMEDVATAATLSKVNNRAVEKHEKQIDNLRKFMWVTLGAVGVVNAVIPAIEFIAKYLK
jgi:uncharacterized protein (UPF0335 family)